MKKNRAQKDILYIAISSFILVCIWVGTNIYHSFVTSTITPDLQAQIEPIDPKFDTDVIQRLKNRKIITPASQATTSSQSAQPTPPEPTATEQESTNSATQNQQGSTERVGQ